MACACDGVQRSVGPREFIWVRKGEDWETVRGGVVVKRGVWEWVDCCGRVVVVGGEGELVREVAGLGEGSSTFT